MFEQFFKNTDKLSQKTNQVPSANFFFKNSLKPPKEFENNNKKPLSTPKSNNVFDRLSLKNQLKKPFEKNSPIFCVSPTQTPPKKFFTIQKCQNNRNSETIQKPGVKISSEKLLKDISTTSRDDKGRNLKQIDMNILRKSSDAVMNYQSFQKKLYENILDH